MKLEKFRFDEKRQQVRARFHELKKPSKRDAPQYVLCSFEFYDFRKDGKRRSEKEQTNLLTRLYAEKLSEVRKKEEQKIILEQQEKQELENFKKLGMKIREVMQLWIDLEIEPNLKSNTLKEYLRTCSLYIENVGDHHIREFKKNHANRFKNCLTQIGISETGIRKHQTQLQIFLNWAYSEEHLDKPVKLNKVRLVSKGPVIYSRYEIDKLQNAIENAIKKAPKGYKERCAKNHMRIFMAFRHAILRNGEILSLPLRNICLQEQEVLITEVPEISWKPKSRQERCIPMNEELLDFLKIDLENRATNEIWFLDNGFGSQAYSSNSQVTQAIRRYLKRLGMSEQGLKPLHSGRSSGITSMLAAGGKADFVMRLAGHRSMQTTMKHYVRPENFDLRETVGLLSNMPENAITKPK